MNGPPGYTDPSGADLAVCRTQAADGPTIEILRLDGSPLRRLVLDPSKDYQRIP